MKFTTPLGWVGDVQYALDISGNNTTRDIPGVTKEIDRELRNMHNIFTINDLVGFTLYNGYPKCIVDNTKFVVSLRCATRLMPDLETSQHLLVHKTSNAPLCPTQT